MAPTEDDFFRFIYKRQLIWYKRFKLKQPYPWTEDPILKHYKIINMYRELDKCTIYLMEKLQEVEGREAQLLNITFFRFFNLAGIYEDLGVKPLTRLDDATATDLAQRFTKLQAHRAIFNNAYLISSGGGGPKHVNVLNNLRDTDWEALITELDEATTPEDAHEALCTIPMVGPFLACEIWTDLAYIHFFKQGWDDNDFVNIGPGAKWGLELLYGKLRKPELEKRLAHLHKEQLSVLPTIHEALGEVLPWETIAYEHAHSNAPFLSLTNVEGALCEFRKYWRLSHGKGKKRYYKPRTQTRLASTQ